MRKALSQDTCLNTSLCGSINQSDVLSELQQLCIILHFGTFVSVRGT